MHHTKLQRSTLSECFYHHLMRRDMHFPKASQEYFTNNSILQQFFIFSYSWSNFPKPQLWQAHKFYFRVYLDKMRPWLSRKNSSLQYPHVMWGFSSTKHLCCRHFLQQNIKTTFILWIFFLSPWWAFFCTSSNMVERNFWQIDTFFLKYFFFRLMIWLDAPYKTLEIQTLRIFLSSSYEVWMEFP